LVLTANHVTLRSPNRSAWGWTKSPSKRFGSWRFEPARRHATPVAVEITVTVSFSLDNNDPRTRELLERIKREAPPQPRVSTSIRPCPSSASGYEQGSSGLSITVAELLFDGALQVPADHQSRSGRQSSSGLTMALWRKSHQRSWKERRLLGKVAGSTRIALTIHVDEGKQY
jgi:hypothetical protein